MSGALSQKEQAHKAAIVAWYVVLLLMELGRGTNECTGVRLGFGRWRSGEEEVGWKDVWTRLAYNTSLQRIQRFILLTTSFETDRRPSAEDSRTTRRSYVHCHHLGRFSLFLCLETPVLEGPF